MVISLEFLILVFQKLLDNFIIITILIGNSELTNHIFITPNNKLKYNI